MVSFQAKLVAGLNHHGIQVSYDLSDHDCSAVLVIGGTRKLAALWQAHRRGVHIVQRLDGMNWLHRKQPTGVRQYLRAEANNQILTVIRRYLADAIIYQSRFSQQWWEKVHGNPGAPSGVIYNGVDLVFYSPLGPHKRPGDHFRILLIEGHLGKDNAQGLDSAVRMVALLRDEHHLPVELVIAGDVAQELQTRALAAAGGQVVFRGVLSRKQIPQIDRSAHLLFSADLNAACPNAVIEAMACGLPVVAFDTGALNELVLEGAGRVVPYGSNHWNLEPPQIPPLAQAAAEILAQNGPFRKAARARAEAVFGVDYMVDSYLQVLLP